MALGRHLRRLADDDQPHDITDLLRKHGVSKTDSVRLIKRGSQKRTPWLHKIDVEDLLHSLDMNNVSRASTAEVLFSCPFPGHSSGDSKPSAYMNTGEKDKQKATLWMCQGCGRRGNAISFVAEYQDITRQDAARLLKQRFGIEGHLPKDGIAADLRERFHAHEQESPRASKSTPTISWERYEKLFEEHVDWDEGEEMWKSGDCPDAIAYMFNRGFAAKTLKAWRIGYDLFTERLTIPICDPEGNLIGVKGRAWKETRYKYMILGDSDKRKRKRYGFKPYDKASVVIGIEKWGEVEVYVLCEGELDVVALWQVGIPAISTGSAHLSEIQSRIVRDHCDEVVVFYDTDKSGDHATWGYLNRDGEFKPGLVQKIRPFLRVRVVEEHKHDPSKLIEKKRIRELRRLIEEAPSSTRMLIGR